MGEFQKVGPFCLKIALLFLSPRKNLGEAEFDRYFWILPPISSCSKGLRKVSLENREEKGE